MQTSAFSPRCPGSLNGFAPEPTVVAARAIALGRGRVTAQRVAPLKDFDHAPLPGNQTALPTTPLITWNQNASAYDARQLIPGDELLQIPHTVPIASSRSHSTALKCDAKRVESADSAKLGTTIIVRH